MASASRLRWSTSLRIHIAAVCQPDATSAPKCERAALLFVDVKGLRIELPREHLDVIGGEQMRAQLDAVADADVVVEAHHDGAPGLRRPNIAGVTIVITHSPWRVEHLVADADDAHLRPAFRGARLQHGDAQV